MLVTIVTVLPSVNAFVEPEMQAAKTNVKPFNPYLVGLLVLGLMTVAASVAAYVVYR